MGYVFEIRQYRYLSLLRFQHFWRTLENIIIFTVERILLKREKTRDT